ncbi:MAG: ABC transporter permease subunit [Candidatus Aminicenantes bacterium]|nr:ABC transporter permease subunit [Candidatus Aminicenantes bacterium]
MWKTIVKKELLENILSYRFPLFGLIAMVLIPLGMYVSQLDYAKRVRDYDEQVRLSAEAASHLSIQEVMAGTVSIKGFRRPAPLSVYTRGFEGALPRYYEFTQEGVKPGESSSGEESILSVQGKVDFVFLVQMVLSLIALLFASDVIAGEKEAGTLRAMLSNRVPRDAILSGKVAGGYAALWAPFAGAFLVGLLLLVLRGFPVFGGDTPAKILVVFLSSSVFLLAYFTLGTMISASSAKTRTALVAILLIWTFFQLIMPKLSDMVAALVYPVRTETQVSLEKSLLAGSLGMETAKELGRQYDLIFGSAPKGAADDEASPERKKWDPLKAGIEQSAKERKTQQLGAIDETYRQQKRRQQDLAVNLSLVSPSAAFARLVADVCGTGELERAKYAEAVQAHARTLDGALFSKVKRTLMIHAGGGTSLGFSAESIDFKTLPQFTIAPASLGDIFKANWKSLLSLLFWLVVPFAAAYVRFIKYDVR